MLIPTRNYFLFYTHVLAVCLKSKLNVSVKINCTLGVKIICTLGMHKININSQMDVLLFTYRSLM